MPFDINCFAKDIALGSFADVTAKYKGKIPEGVKVRDVVDSLDDQRLLNNLIRADWKNDGTDKDGLYLIISGLNFEVFTGERGLKNWKEVFSDIKSASASFVDCLLNELRHSSPDTKIK